MSDSPMGNGWWLADDGLYYPPERHPDYVPIAELSIDLGEIVEPQPPTIKQSKWGPITEFALSADPSSPIDREILQAGRGETDSPKTLADVMTVSRPPRSSKRSVITVGIILALGLLIGLGAVLIRPKLPKTDVSLQGSGDMDSVDMDSVDIHSIEGAAASCDLSASVGDGGASVSIDTEGEEDYTGDSWESTICLLEALEAPDWVISRIRSTRALDGTQDASWENYGAFWNYHPNSGLNLTIHEDR